VNLFRVMKRNSNFGSDLLEVKKMVYKKMLAALLFGIIFTLIGVSEVNALESNLEYFIDSENMFFIVAVDSSNKVTFVNGGMAVNDEWHEFDENQIKVWRTTDEGDKGRIFGRTTQGDLYYAIYDIENGKATVYSKLWHDGIKTRIVEDATVEKLFG